MDPLVQFLQGPRRNEWITDGPMRVYIRKANHIIAGALIRTLDVASVSVDPDARRRGVFSLWLAGAEKLAREQGLVVRVESILNPHLSRFLSRRGYIRVPNTVPQQVDMYLPGDVRPDGLDELAGDVEVEVLEVVADP